MGKIKAGDKPRRISSKVLEAPEEPRSDYPVFSFMHVADKHCLLSKWRGKELDELIEALKTMEQLTWDRIGTHNGLRFTPISNPAKPLPERVSPDETIYEIRVCSVKRVFGYRTGNVFRILWFDREHEVCPWHKVKRS